ncbi:universal stress protein UspA [Thioalkalivibrio denitrificans]|uniref:Universal stress protein n=1 Tax=Thioalkalivibrio denitrificans TaxID=108003 RepID=A0A1V3NDR6_9GAMM|nr:universal stress protein [Thioalkalivibrio denitrificans]OOG22936.1 universal stress protein UspA [Thioalkalivibrio denitrificans]
MKPGYRHLLVCVDLSATAAAVLSRARTLASPGACRMTVLHVVEHRPLPDLDYGLGTLPGLEMDLDTALDSARSRLDALFSGLATDAAERRVVAGIPHLEINRLAEELDVDLVVLGSSTRTGLGRLLGSTAHSVLNHAPCDVLAVRVSAPETGADDT